MNETISRQAPISRYISIACAAAAMAAGAIVLLGWTWHIEPFKSIVPGTVSMKANTALGFLTAGFSLLLFNFSGPENDVNRRLARALAAFTALVGLATLSQYVFGRNLGIDQLLFTEPAGAVATVIPGRMAPATAINFILYGLALLSFEKGFILFGQALALVTGLTGLAALAGYAYGVEALTAILFFVSYTRMAVNTALAFMTLGLGLIFLRPGKGLGAFFSDLSSLAAGLLVILAAGFILPAAGHMLMSLFYGHAIWAQAPFHSAVEAVNSVTALLIAWLVFWLLENEKLSPDYTFVPPALAAIGLLNALHGCVSPGNAYVLLHTSAMVLGGFLFALSWVAGRARPRRAYFLASAAGIAALGVFIIFRADSLPPLILGGEYTRTARLFNMAGGLFFLTAAARFTLSYLRGRKIEDQLLSIFCFLKAWAGALFYSTSVYGIDWWYWHLLRLTAHGVLLSYLFIAFRRVAASEREAEIARLAAEEASRSKSEFLSNMSHEFRTPLNSIIGFSEALEDQLFGPLTAKQGQYVGYVLGSSRHLLNLVNDILDLSKVEAGKMDFEPETVAVKELLEGINEMFETKAMERGLVLRLELDPAADVEIKADRRKLKQIMFNLLANAVKFTPDGGSIAVKAAAVGGGGLEVSVADTGMGIKAEDMPKLFREFGQLDSGYTKRHEGTGLGLALTKRLVELHGGTIRAESAGPGKGAAFTFTLPAAGAALPAETEA